uniref:EF-hand domain-containing protein n=1 Tax=Zooxanthella nutricula TaxID=1333877 RepID=A0A7S2Q899_9DINO
MAAQVSDLGRDRMPERMTVRVPPRRSSVRDRAGEAFSFKEEAPSAGDDARDAAWRVPEATCSVPLPGEVDADAPNAPPTTMNAMNSTSRSGRGSAKASTPSLSRANTRATPDKEALTWEFQQELTRRDRIAKELGIKERLEQSMDRVQQSRGWKFIHSAHFQLLVSFIILLQAAMVGYGAQVALTVAVKKEMPPPWVSYVELSFSVFFIVELAFRIGVEQWCFVLGPEWRWNAFDSILVILSLVDISNASKTGNAMIGRVFRVSRFFALMRVSRVMRQLPSMRTILLSILDSIISLVWCFVFIAFIMYVFAVLISFGAAEQIRDLPWKDPEVLELRRWWGSLYRCFVTLFMAISGGADWVDMTRPLLLVNEWYECLIVLYVFLMSFGILNVVIGTFVATVHNIAAQDRDSMQKYKLHQCKEYMGKIREFFREADVDRSGTLSWNEFKTHLASPTVKAYFQALDLDVSHAHLLFTLLDEDGNDEVSLDEFLNGCMRLRGEAKSVDLNMLVYVCQVSFERIFDYMQTKEGPVDDGVALKP